MSKLTAPTRVGRNASRIAAVTLLAIFSGLVACDDGDPLTPDELDETHIPGTYHGVTFQIEQGQDITLILVEEDGELQVVLDEDGTLSGTLFVPGYGEGGTDIDETLSGSWTFDDLTDEVTLTFDGSQLLPAEIDMTGEIVGEANYAINLSGSVDTGDASIDLILESEVRS